MTRIEPAMAPEAYKTYEIVVPATTHFRSATCEEVACQQHANGWRVRVEGLPPEMVHTAKNCGRKYEEQRIAEGETWLLFEAGQRCFQASQHRTRIDKPELYIVRDGDHRGNPRGTKGRLHQRPADWRDDFAEHQQGLADAFQEG